MEWKAHTLILFLPFFTPHCRLHFWLHVSVNKLFITHTDAGSLRAELMLSNMQIKYFCLMPADTTYFLTECVGVVCQSKPPHLIFYIPLHSVSHSFMCCQQLYIHHVLVQLSNFLAPLTFSSSLCFFCFLPLRQISSTEALGTHN